MKWAVLGASGFIGSRFVEKIHLAGEDSVRPIVRSFSSLARLARFELDWRVTDISDEPKLTQAMEGCDVLLHSVVGGEEAIMGSIRPVYEAAQRAGIRRIVYLSSSAVHGLNPLEGTTEDTPLSDRQSFVYNNAKVKAERLFQKVRQQGTVEVVSLRPSIVFGPRSRWCSDLAKDALGGTSWLLQEGRGICNTIYVDNLIHAIALAAKAQNVNGMHFLIRDEETVTWREFYAPILEACGVPASEVHQVQMPKFTRSWTIHLNRFRTSSFLRKVKPLMPSTTLRVSKAALNALLASPVGGSPWESDGKPSPNVTEEMAYLQLCTWQMPCSKAKKILGYQPKISFSEGMRRSMEWLKFAGYPVQMAKHENA